MIMSNTSNLTPYDASTAGSGTSTIGTGAGLACGIAVACAAGAVLGAVALARWLSEETPEDRRAVERMKQERRRELLESYKSGVDLSKKPVEFSPIKTVNLNLRELEPLVLSAQKLGYQTEPLIQPAKPLSQQPQILLRNASGERMVIERSPKGRLVVSTAGEHSRIQNLVRQHTVDRAIEHLSSRMDMELKIARLGNGEVQIHAQERNAKRGGAAELKAQVQTDGSAWVDIEKVRGNRCEEIVSQLAQAIGAEVNGMKKKDSYYQLPGEPAKTKVRV
jgi:hypothetical protein